MVAGHLQEKNGNYYMVLNYLVENYNIAPISTPEEDLKKILG